jgi:hypothetical protein
MTAGKITPRSAAEWAAVLPLWLGMVGLLSVLIFWMFTGRFEAAFLTTFGSLALGGQGLKVLENVKNPPAPAPRRKPPTKPGRSKA